MPFYDDVAQPGCTVSGDGGDGIVCEDESVRQCLSAIGLTIQVVDRSVHVKHTFDVPLTKEVLTTVELQQRMADVFVLQQQPAIVFPLSITPLDCGLPANTARPICQSAGPGGQHRRRERRLQTQVGADTEHACPQSSFGTKESAMRAQCGILSLDPTNPLLQGECPSLQCAQALLPLLEDCAEHIAEFARHIGPEAAFYDALHNSEIANNCDEMDQRSAEFASVQVEFRAPTRAVADQMIREHELMVREQFQPPSEVDGGQLCFGNPDDLRGDGTRCGGRRRLGDDLSIESCADKDEQIRRLTALLEKKDGIIEQAQTESLEKDKVIDQQAKMNQKQGQTIALNKRLRQLDQNKEAAISSFSKSGGQSKGHPESEVSKKRSDFSMRRVQTTDVSCATTTTRGTACALPFEYNGATYNQCTDIDQPGIPWCFVDAAFDEWGNCACSGTSALISARVGSDLAVKACAVHPCELSEGVCQNGGTCVEVAAEGRGAVPFTCQCTGRFGGARCETNLCEVVDGAGPRAGTFEVLSGPCTVAADRRRVGRPTGYDQNETCNITVHGSGGTLGPCPVFQTIDYRGLRGRADRRDALTITFRDGHAEQFSGGDGPQCFEGSTCSVGFYGQGVCNGCPAGSRLMAGDTITWAAGMDDSGLVSCDAPDRHASQGATRTMAGWELSFGFFVDPCAGTCDTACAANSLLAFKASGNGNGLDGWVSGGDPCADSWAGVCCGDGGWEYSQDSWTCPVGGARAGASVTGLHLFGTSGPFAGLTGNIGSLAPLGEALVTLDLTLTAVTGDVGGVGGLAGLANLGLSGTAVSGDVSGLGSLSGLVALALGGTAVTGDVSGLGGLVRLADLGLYRTAVSGDVAGLVGMAGLDYLDLVGTAVKGWPLTTAGGCTFSDHNDWYCCDGGRGDTSCAVGR